MKPHPREHLTSHVIVWIAHLSKVTDSPAELERYLDERDRERAARFHFPADRHRFVLGRAMVRTSLGRYMEMPAERIELDYTRLGRPFFPHDDTIQFSISHTQDLVGLALTSGARVGLDLEAVEQDLGPSELAERILSPVDFKEFQALPAQDKLPAFYRVWTRKEAYLKARGEGIAERLKDISVSMGAEKAITIHDGRNIFPAEKWHLASLPVPAGYAGTLACDDRQRRVEGTSITFIHGEPVPDVSSAFSWPPA